MKDRIILTQERQTSDTCIKISSLDCNLLVDFLIKEKVAFSIIPCGQESDSSIHEEELAEGSNQILSDTEQFLETVYLKYILKNSASTPSIEKISEEAGWTQSIFKSRFKAYYGKPFYQAYMEKKMKYAAELLNKSWKAADVSEEVGYAQPIKFNKMFQKHFGITPKKFQKKHKLSGFK